MFWWVFSPWHVADRACNTSDWLHTASNKTWNTEPHGSEIAGEFATTKCALVMCFFSTEVLVCYVHWSNLSTLPSIEMSRQKVVCDSWYMRTLHGDYPHFISCRVFFRGWNLMGYPDIKMHFRWYEDEWIWHVSCTITSYQRISYSFLTWFICFELLTSFIYLILVYPPICFVTHERIPLHELTHVPTKTKRTKPFTSSPRDS